MPLTKSTVKTPIGMLTSWFFPITAEPANARPIYGDKLDMGAAVKGYLSVTSYTGTVPGDDTNQVDMERFAYGQLDAETTMSDLEVNAKIFGHSYTESGGEISSSDDSAPDGGYAFVQSILKKDKNVIYRATCLHKVTAIASSEKQEADTRKPGELNPKNNPISYKVKEDATGAWRTRNDFATLEAAHAFIASVFKAS